MKYGANCCDIKAECVPAVSDWPSVEYCIVSNFERHGLFRRMYDCTSRFNQSDKSSVNLPSGNLHAEK